MKNISLLAFGTGRFKKNANLLYTGKTPGADLYCAAIAVRTGAGKVTKWVRRRDVRHGYYAKEKIVGTFGDPYWELKLK